MSLTKTVTDETFQKEVIHSSLPVLVDCWADWCAPCKLIAPIIDQLSVEYKNKFRIYKLDVSSNLKTTMNYGISSIPTLLFFKQGQFVNQLIGAHKKEEIKDKMEELLR